MTLQNIVLHTVIFAFTPLDNSVPPVTLKADTLQNEEEFITAPQYKNPKADTFSSADGENGATVENAATNGTRDIKVFEQPGTDILTAWAQRKPMVAFNLKFTYELDNGSGGDPEQRSQIHKHCRFAGPGIRGIGGNNAPIITFPITFMTLKKAGKDGTVL